MGMGMGMGMRMATFCYKNLALRNTFPRKPSPQEVFCYKNFPLRNTFPRELSPQQLVSEGEHLGQRFVAVERALAAAPGL